MLQKISPTTHSTSCNLEIAPCTNQGKLIESWIQLTVGSSLNKIPKLACLFDLADTKNVVCPFSEHKTLRMFLQS